MCIAAQEGHLECVRILLEWGANPVHSDRCGRTPIRVALKSGHVAISKLLEEVALARSKTCKWMIKNINTGKGLKTCINYSDGERDQCSGLGVGGRQD